MCVYMYICIYVDMYIYTYIYIYYIIHHCLQKVLAEGCRVISDYYVITSMS